MGYIEQNLMLGERIIYQSKLHWVVFLSPVIIGLLGGLIVLGSIPDNSLCMGVGAVLLWLALLNGVAAYISYTTSEFAVTNERVLIKTGLLQHRYMELLLTRIEGIGVEQKLLGRILGYGTIVVTGTGGTKEPFANIADPLEFRRRVQAQIVAKENIALPPGLD